MACTAVARSTHLDWLDREDGIKPQVGGLTQKALQNPLRVGASQCFETLFHRVGAGPLLTKTIGVFISGGFHNGGECEQMQRLLCSILHRGNSERAHRFAVRLRDVNTS